MRGCGVWGDRLVGLGRWGGGGSFFFLVFSWAQIKCLASAT